MTTSNPDAALNFGLDDHMEHAERYKRAREFYDVVTGLWDSFADDAFIRNVETGIYIDPEKMHVLDHKGPSLGRGPLNIARPVQGWPVIVQAGASEDGSNSLPKPRKPCSPAAVRSAKRKALCRYQGPHGALGRDRDHLKILPGAFVVVGDSVDEAKEKRALLDARCITPRYRLALDQARHRRLRLRSRRPAAEIPETNASKSGRERVIALAGART